MIVHFSSPPLDQGYCDSVDKWKIKVIPESFLSRRYWLKLISFQTLLDQRKHTFYDEFVFASFHHIRHCNSNYNCTVKYYEIIYSLIYNYNYILMSTCVKSPISGNIYFFGLVAQF